MHQQQEVRVKKIHTVTPEQEENGSTKSEHSSRLSNELATKKAKREKDFGL